MPKKSFLILILVWVVLVLVGCQGSVQEQASPTVEATASYTPTSTPTSTPTASPQPSPTATQTPEPVLESGPEEYPEGVNPLTGLRVAEEVNLDRRPLATKIQLFPRYGRPPIGINAADLVWEYYHNGGITRLHVVYYGQDAAEFGPIRSARMPDDDLVSMYKSIFAYGSADRRINQRLFNAEYAPYLVLEGGSSPCPPTVENPMCRIDPEGQNLLLSGTEELTEFIRQEENLSNERQDLAGMRFALPVPAGGVPGEVLNIRYSADSYLRWEYDEASGSYLRLQDTKLDDGSGEEYEILVERDSESPVSASNVILLLAEHSYFFRSGNSEIVEIDLLGTGEGLVYRDGQVYEVTWSRPTSAALLTVLGKDGEVFPLKPGNTWFQVIGTSSAVSAPEEHMIRFEFSIP